MPTGFSILLRIAALESALLAIGLLVGAFTVDAIDRPTLVPSCSSVFAITTIPALFIIGCTRCALWFHGVPRHGSASRSR